MLDEGVGVRSPNAARGLLPSFFEKMTIKTAVINRIPMITNGTLLTD